MAWRDEKLRILVASKLMAKNPEGAHRVAVVAGDHSRGTTLEEIGPESLVHAVPRLLGLLKESPADD
jgi:hypothetical protein